MNSLEIVGYKSFQYASCIEELTPDEFQYMMLLLLQQQNGEISITDFRKLLACKLLRIKKTVKYYTMPDEDRAIVYDHINRITDSLDSFYEDAEDDGRLIKRLNLNWVQQMLPRIGRLIGPTDALTNCSFFEHKEAYTRYLGYINDQDEEMINELIAILYRPQKLAWNIRKLLSRRELSQRVDYTSYSNQYWFRRRVAKARKLPMHIKTAVFLWYGNCVDYIRTGTPTIDGNEIDFSLLFDKTKTEDSGPSGIGLTGIVFSLAESGVFGDVDKCYNTNLYDVLVRLYQLKIDYDKMNKKSRKSNDEN